MTLVNIFWIIVFGLIVYMMFKKGGGCCGGHGGHNDHSGHGGREDKSLPPTDHHARKMSHDNAKDPVCGMDVTGDSAVSEFHGRTFHFCSEKCRKLFDLNPNKYAGA